MSSMITNYANLLQTKNNPQNTAVQAPPKSVVIPEVVNQESLKTGVRAYAPKGHLVKESFLKSLVTPFVQDYENVKNFFKATNGEGTDYSIGRINNTAIKLGSLGIAAIIASSKSSPLQKGMEFVGLASWLGAMSLWPKLAVYAPIKLTKGVDLGLEYEDSYGRRKLFYQDPQYICWDMIPDEELYKMGDKLGIPKDIDDRKGAIKEKARQIAIQGNTAAMITAGFATPLIASLVADQVGKRIYKPQLLKFRNKAAEKSIATLNANIDKIHTNQNLESQLEQILKSNTLDEKAKIAIKDVFLKQTTGLETQKTVLDTVDRIFTALSNKEATLTVDAKLPDEIIKVIRGSQKTPILAEFDDMLNDVARKITEKPNMGRIQIDEYIATVRNTLEENPILKDSKKIDIAIDNLTALLESRKTVQMADPKAITGKLTQLARMVETYKISVNQNLETILKSTVLGDSSNLAQLWEDGFKDVIKAFGIKGDTLKELAKTPSVERTNEILEKVLNEIVGDDQKFGKTAKALEELANNSIKTNKEMLETSLKYLDDMEDLFAKNFLSEELTDLHKQFYFMISKRRQSLIAKYVSANNTFQAPLRVLSVFDNIRSGVNLPKGLPGEVEEQTKLIKKLVLDSLDVDNFINKFNSQRALIDKDHNYYLYMEKVLGPLNPRVKGLISAETANTVDQNTSIFRALFMDLCDDVNTRLYRPQFREAVERLQGSVVGKYIDDFFHIEVKNTGEYANAVLSRLIPENGNSFEAIQKLNCKLPLVAKKGEELSRVTRQELQAFYDKKGSYPAIIQEFYDALCSYAKNGRAKIRTFFTLFNEKQLSLGTIDKDGKPDAIAKLISGSELGYAKPGKVTNAGGKTFSKFLKESAQQVLSYKSWLTKVCIGLGAVASVALVSVAMVGRKNEFNPDVYEKKGA